MFPIEVDGGLYYPSGVRASPAEEFRYLHLPADPDGGVDRFMALIRQLRQPERLPPPAAPWTASACRSSGCASRWPAKPTA